MNPDPIVERDAGAPASAARERRLVWLSYSAMVVLGINVGWLGPFLPQIARAMHTPLDRAGLILSATAAGYFVALPPAGEIGHRRGAHLLLTVALFLDALGWLGLGLAPNLAVALCAGAIVGVGQCGIDIATNTLVAELHRERLSSALNYLHLMFGLGASLGPAIDALALAHGAGYRATFASGAAAIAAIAAMLLLTARLPVKAQPGETLELRSMLSHPLIWVLTLVLLLYVGAEVGVGAWLFTYLRMGRAPFGVSQASLAVSVYWAGLMCGRLVGGRFGDRVSARALAVVGSVLAALALSFLLLMPSGSGLVFPAVFITGVGYGPVFPNMIAIGAERFPSRVASMTSIVAAGAAVGAVLLPWAMGVVLVAGGRGASVALAIAVTLSMAAVIAAGIARRPTVRVE